MEPSFSPNLAKRLPSSKGLAAPKLPRFAPSCLAMLLIWTLVPGRFSSTGL
jgi:hypothetical protein